MTGTLTILHPGLEDVSAPHSGAGNASAAAHQLLAGRLATLQGMRVGLLDNGKVNAGAFLTAVASRLKQRGVGEVRMWTKPHASESGAPYIAELMRWKPDLALTGLGD